MAKRALVTGGAGFIGSHLVKRLVKSGFDVRVLDNFHSGRKENLTEVIDRIELIKGDIRNYKTVEKSVKGVDAIFHLAALIDVQESLRKPKTYHEVNSTGTLNLLKAATKQKITKFIYTSTCAVYGNPIRLPIDENHPLNPLSPYAASKLSAENYCKAFSKSYGLKTTILRLFNVYGPNQNTSKYSGVILEFIKRIRRDKPPIIFGDGNQTRDFIYVEDVADFLIKALEIDANGVFNIGTGKQTSINQLASTLLKITGKSHLKPIYEKPRPGDIKHSVADISKAVKTFHIKPKTSLEEGLKIMINSVNNPEYSAI
ncbi:MAG: hypothetical protein DRJ31_06840 [Candidatus Methanomethylicota archaeon]|uniref:NAD-dependent epimerase/dehydratase domain-containing protein n=1 Tax=Thermoproteota archaeon TaxID=2056631 RepID=A0A497EN28_9CREN|nr:MAG: hypothetical protein DRJ31_06840 [Candidatus Verstraetearchaeota archaeon]